MRMPAKLNFLRWRGVLAEASAAVRRATAIVLALMCVTLAFTQWGFIGVQFADGATAYIVSMIVPVAIAALALGTAWGTGLGCFSGSVLCLHALLTPLDYYELAYVTPSASILGMTLFGFVLGSLLACILNGRFTGWRRNVLVVLACCAASVVFSARFSIGIIASSLATLVSEAGLDQNHEQLAQLHAKAVETAFFKSHVSFQVFADSILTAIFSLAGITLGERGMREAGVAGLREVFGARLLTVVFVAFMIIATAAYGAVTAAELADGQEHMRNAAEYLLCQVENTSALNKRIVEAFSEDENSSNEAMEGLVESASADVLVSILEGHAEETDGLILVSIDGHVVCTDVGRLNVDGKASVGDLLGGDIQSAAQRSAQHETLERIVYLAPNKYSDLIDTPGTEKMGDSLLIHQVGYLMAVQDDNCEVVIIRPAGMLFDGRDDVVFWITLSSLALLVAVFALTSRLLDRMVARRIDATNDVLGRITDGDLNARIMPEGTREFWDLAAGINVTVDALQGWIAEAESRMDEELAAAKVIQEQALPNVFPPFPHITRFGIFASMKTAREVGGDFYDFFLLGDKCGPEAGKLAFVIADVSGKGVPAALFMMKAKTKIRDCLEGGLELGEAIDSANAQLCDGNDGDMFVTAWIGVLDYGTGHVEYVNAGHNPPLLLHEGTTTWLKDVSGMPLGVFDDFPYETFAIDCSAGDKLLLYTDGVNEAFSVEREQYGEHRLEEAARECHDLTPRELIEHVRASVAAFAKGAEQSDDITMLALEVREERT